MQEYDLEERTSSFGVGIITFAKAVPKNQITNSLVDQLVRSGTSVGANYCEANESISKKDFKHRISICAKEAKETKHWLRMIVAAEPQCRSDAENLWREAKELHLIFAAIKRNCNTSKDV
jgi:four helix bundle protein